MSENRPPVRIIAVVEGHTERYFVEKVLGPYLSANSVFMTSTIVSKPGQKGGDVRFSRTSIELRNHLMQHRDWYVTTIIDYYGTKEWPGIDTIRHNMTPRQISDNLRSATIAGLSEKYPKIDINRRFIPYFSLHEFEALLFSDCTILAKHINIAETQVQEIVTRCGGPESVNNDPATAPSKRLDAWAPSGIFPKTTKGVEIAKEIGVPAMREKCPVFDGWLSYIEALPAL